jgi:hypothetical protein
MRCDGTKRNLHTGPQLPGSSSHNVHVDNSFHVCRCSQHSYYQQAEETNSGPAPRLSRFWSRILHCVPSNTCFWTMTSQNLKSEQSSRTAIFTNLTVGGDSWRPGRRESACRVEGFRSGSGTAISYLLVDQSHKIHEWSKIDIDNTLAVDYLRQNGKERDHSREALSRFMTSARHSSGIRGSPLHT